MKKGKIPLLSPPAGSAQAKASMQRSGILPIPMRSILSVNSGSRNTMLTGNCFRRKPVLQRTTANPFSQFRKPARKAATPFCLSVNMCRGRSVQKFTIPTARATSASQQYRYLETERNPSHLPRSGGILCFQASADLHYRQRKLLLCLLGS